MNPESKPLEFFENNGYEHGFCECFRDPIWCLATWCCGPCVIGHLRGLLNNQQFDLLSCCCAYLGAYRNRKDIQKRYNIKECDDATMIGLTCCACCAISQDAHELVSRLRKENSTSAPSAAVAPAVSLAPNPANPKPSEPIPVAAADKS